AGDDAVVAAGVAAGDGGHGVAGAGGARNAGAVLPPLVGQGAVGSGHHREGGSAVQRRGLVGRLGEDHRRAVDRQDGAGGDGHRRCAAEGVGDDAVVDAGGGGGDARDGDGRAGRADGDDAVLAPLVAERAVAGGRHGEGGVAAGGDSDRGRLRRDRRGRRPAGGHREGGGGGRRRGGGRAQRVGDRAGV